MLALGRTFGIVTTICIMTSSLYSHDGAAEETPYGSWSSPQSAADIFAAADYVSDLFADGDQLYFIEKRASANGRNVLVRLGKNNSLEQLTDSESVPCRLIFG